MQKIKKTGFLTAVDLSVLSRQYDKGAFDQDNFFFVHGDFTDTQVQQEILRRGPYNLLLCDAAPATSGNRAVDTGRSFELAQAVMGYAETALEKNANLLIKIFQGEDSLSILKQMKDSFTNAKSYKPKACRGSSFETYYLGLGKQ